MNKYRGVRGGTPIGMPLCRTCAHATMIRGNAESQAVTFCQILGGEYGAKPLPWEAYECSAYTDKRITPLHEMKAIAWQLRTDAVTKKIVGFVSPETLTHAEKFKSLPGE